MDKWKQGFAEKIEALQDQWRRQFDVLVEETLEPVFSEFDEFVRPWDFQASIPQAQSPVRTFKFTLAEDAYVLVFFRSKGVDTVQCLYEYAIPGQGTSKSRRSDTVVRNVSREWAKDCFQTALDDFVAKLTEAERARETAEPALA